MAIDLPLDKMTTSQKLEALEAIWADLSRSPSDVEAPSWHANILESRKAKADSDAGRFQSWADAKRDIRDQVE